MCSKEYVKVVISSPTLAIGFPIIYDTNINRMLFLCVCICVCINTYTYKYMVLSFGQLDT